MFFGSRFRCGLGLLLPSLSQELLLVLSILLCCLSMSLSFLLCCLSMGLSFFLCCLSILTSTVI